MAEKKKKTVLKVMVSLVLVPILIVRFVGLTRVFYALLQNVGHTEAYLDYVEWTPPFFVDIRRDKIDKINEQVDALEYIGKNQEKNVYYYAFGEIPSDQWIVVRFDKGWLDEWRVYYNPQTVSDPDSYFKPLYSEITVYPLSYQIDKKFEFSNSQYLDQLYQSLWTREPLPYKDWLSYAGFDDYGKQKLGLAIYLEESKTLYVWLDLWQVEDYREYYYWHLSARQHGDIFIYDDKFIYTDEWLEITKEFP